MHNLRRPTTDAPKLSRRTLLLRIVPEAGLLLIMPALLAACGSTEPPPASTAAPVNADAADAACADEAALSANDSAARDSLHYVDASTDPAKQCHNCQFFQPPQAGAACGGCQLLPGLVAPTGSCNSWVQKIS